MRTRDFVHRPAMHPLGYFSPPNGGLGLAPQPLPGTASGLLGGLTLMVSGALTAMFVLRVIGSVKGPIWKAVGYAAMTGGGLGALYGLARVLSEFIPEEKPRV